MTATVTHIRSRQRRSSTTADPYLLHTEQLHRVDASQLAADDGVCIGHCRTDIGLCAGHPDCAGTACQMHPGTASDTTGLDHTATPARSLLSWLMAVVVFLLMTILVAVFGPPQDH